MSTPPIRVLVVDDSAFVRKVVRETLSSEPGLEVVGIAHDGLDAMEKIDALRPDVVTLDLVMPHLDGLGVLRALRGRRSPRVIVVSSADADGELVLSALEEGAVDFVHKPTAQATDVLYTVRDDLVSKLRAAAGARIALASVLPATLEQVGAMSTNMIVIGTSTGGPQALVRLLSALPADLPAPIAMTLHIPRGYTRPFAARLNALSPLEVLEAEDGMALVPGRVVLARAGTHLKISGRGARAVARLEMTPLGMLHCPSVDVLFESAASAYGADAVGVVLTGMGNDGLLGAHAIHRKGGRILVEAESSCVIYGMPRCVQEAGIADLQIPLEHMAAALVEEVSRPAATSRSPA